MTRQGSAFHLSGSIAGDPEYLEIWIREFELVTTQNAASDAFDPRSDHADYTTGRMMKST